MSGHLSLGRTEGTGRQPLSQDSEVPISRGFSSVPWGRGPCQMAGGLLATMWEFSWSLTLHPKFRVKGC